MGECIICLLYSDCYTTIMYDLDGIWVDVVFKMPTVIRKKQLVIFVLFAECKSQVHAPCIEGVSSMYKIIKMR